MYSSLHSDFASAHAADRFARSQHVRSDRGILRAIGAKLRRTAHAPSPASPTTVELA